MFFFFFQAEDGIRDYKVTGVQTCALPISCAYGTSIRSRISSRPRRLLLTDETPPPINADRRFAGHCDASQNARLRSEERRVGKECRARWAADDEKKKARCKEG